MARLGGRARRVACFALVGVICVAGALWATPSAASEFSDKNHPEYWEDLGFGDCVKHENPSTPYTLAAPPSGFFWSLLVVKAGSPSSTNDPHAEYHNPLPGVYHHPSGKQISHVIVCKKPGVGTTTTTPGSTTTSPCGPYVPRDLALNLTAAEPGQTVTLSGVAGGGDPLIVTISGHQVTTTTLATFTTTTDGSFSVDIIIPDQFPSGRTYTLTVKSIACNRSATITILTQSVDRSGCGEGNPLVLIKGEPTTWNLISGSPPFNRNRQITLTLIRRGSPDYSALISTGLWGTGVRTITVPTDAPDDRYFLVQDGVQKNGKPRSESCPIRVATTSSYQAISALQPGGPSSSSNTAGMVQVVVVTLVGGSMLVRLRARRRAVLRRV